MTEAAASMQPLRGVTAVDGQTDALTLLDAEVWPLAKGDGLKLPAVRVLLDSVDCWWIAGEEQVAQGGGSLFIGGIVSIPED